MNMATPPKVSELDPDKLKKLIQDISNDNNIIIDPHGGLTRQYQKRSPQRRELIQEEMPYTARGPMSQRINHCQLNGGGNSTCYACHYNDDKSKIQCQKACNFFRKASFNERCMWETFGEFCGSTKAQDDKKAKGF